MLYCYQSSCPRIDAPVDIVLRDRDLQWRSVHARALESCMHSINELLMS